MHFRLSFIFAVTHMPTHSCLGLLVLWCFGSCSNRPLQHSHRTVVGPASKRPRSILGPCSCFNIGRSGQSRRKPPPPLLPPPFLFELCPLSSISLSSPHNNQSRTGRWITIIVLEHSATLQKTQEKGRIVIWNSWQSKWSSLFPDARTGHSLHVHSFVWQIQTFEISRKLKGLTGLGTKLSNMENCWMVLWIILMSSLVLVSGVIGPYCWHCPHQKNNSISRWITKLPVVINCWYTRY